MADINLLSNNGGSSSFSKSRASWVVRILSVIMVLVILYYGYLFIAIRSSNNQLADWKSKTVQAQADAISRKDRAELLTRQGQLQNINTLIKDHMYWSYLLPELARITLKSANYTSIAADSKGLLTLTVTANSYSELDKYLQVFNLPEFNKQFSDVKVLSLTKSQENSTVQNTMNLQLKFNPDFIRNPTQ